MGTTETSQEIVWQELANELGADFVYGGLFGKHIIRKRYLKWEMVLDTYYIRRQIYTRLRVPILNPDNYMFELTKTSLLDETQELIFNSTSISTGDSEFDAVFKIEGSDQILTSKLFSNENLRQLIPKSAHLVFNIEQKPSQIFERYPKNVSAISLTDIGLIVTKDTLKNWFHLVEMTLDKMSELKITSETSPDYSIK